MGIRSKTLGAIIAVMIFGGIMGASALGLWNTRRGGTAANLQLSQLLGEGAGTGAYAPADIRGNFRFGEISELFGIPLEILARAFDLPADVDPASFKNQDFGSIYPEFGGEQEIGNGSIKWLVALYTGLPFAFEDDEEATYLLRPAVDILMSQADLTEEQIAYLEAHCIDMGTESSELGTPEDPPQPNEDAEGAAEEAERKQDAMLVAGKTTFADLLEWGVPSEKVEAIIGTEMPNDQTLVKDHCSEEGLPFAAIKADLQVEIDKLN